MEKLEISLLISTYQRPHLLRLCLASIQSQQGVEGAFEVIVSDDGSTDETPRVVDEFARSVKFPVSYATHPHTTFHPARCRNKGARAARAPYLLFVDGDCVLPPHHVRTHLERRRRNTARTGYVARLDANLSKRFSEETVRRGRFMKWVPSKERMKLRRMHLKAGLYYLRGHPIKPKIYGGDLGIWRSDLVEVNGYNEDFRGWGCEDDDLRWRLGRTGVRVASILKWTYSVHLWHPPTPSAPTQWRDGINVDYLHRPGRLARCRNGLVKRKIEDLTFRTVGRPVRPVQAVHVLGERLMNSATHSAEVEIVILPGAGTFSGRADCNVLVVLEGCARAARLARAAHILLADREYPPIPRDRSFKLNRVDQVLAAIL